LRVSFAGITAGEDVGYNVSKSITYGLDTSIEGLLGGCDSIVREEYAKDNFFDFFELISLFRIKNTPKKKRLQFPKALY
jgi:hypothetical protein